ncbi:MAG: aldo/keto reductase [Propionibacteriaceae bacterium]|jgi:diketogulonate reductase-like aldo/keto reductase|nr:aldo/keto reductase [Propionibacteriaceae bacterium]
MSVPAYKLNDETSLPAIGLGTYKLNGFASVAAIMSGLSMGYRLVDSAVNYENEGAVGAAVRKTEVPRDEIVVTSKLPGRHHAYGEAVLAIEESLLSTGLDYLDLYLIHWPNPITNRFVEAWQALIDCQERGLVKSIGVSNFLPEHIQRLIGETGVAPAVNQIERHPYYPQSAQVAFDSSLGIRDEAWSPLLRGVIGREQPSLAEIAAAHGKSAAQIILRWHVQTGVVPIPKASSTARQAENLDIFDFELTAGELAVIAAYATPGGQVHAERQPAVYEEF